MSRRGPTWPTYLGWTAGLIVLMLLGPIGFAVVMLDSRPPGTGADPSAKVLIAFLVLCAAALAGFAARGLAVLVLRLARRRDNS